MDCVKMPFMSMTRDGISYGKGIDNAVWCGCVLHFLHAEPFFFMTYDSVRCGFDICILHYANYLMTDAYCIMPII